MYRIFCAFLGPEPMAEDLTPERVRSYRDQLERAERTPATVAKHLSALRQSARRRPGDPHRPIAERHARGAARFVPG
ncbi:MAG: hypothetical protein ACXVV5_21695 [Solirubrobacteraceae bacterium]